MFTKVSQLLSSSQRTSHCIASIDAITKALTEIDNGHSLHAEEANRIKHEAIQRWRLLKSRQRDLAEIEEEIKDDVDFMVAQARTEAATWRVEARQKEVDSVKNRQRRSKERQVFDARSTLIDSLIRQDSDPMMTTPFIEMRYILDSRHPGEAAFQSLEEFEVAIRDQFASQTDATAKKMARIRWEFSFAHALHWVVRCAFGFLILVLLVDEAIHILHRAMVHPNSLWRVDIE
jgi:hypothetical protein